MIVERRGSMGARSSQSSDNRASDCRLSLRVTVETSPGSFVHSPDEVTFANPT